MRISLIGASVCCAAILGCSHHWETQRRAKYDLGVDVVSPDVAGSAAFQDTIGSVAYVDGLGPLRVRGLGLVVGLGKNGSRECPRSAREQLVQSLHKLYRFTGGPISDHSISPEKLIDDIDTAVVMVQGEIPGAAVEGSRFDVVVTALPGTQTKSLRGGRLFTAELEVFRETAPGSSISGQVVARAAGPVFLNPFADATSATRVSLLEGTVVGGGKVTKARDLQLVLSRPSYAMARSIQERINNRFTSGHRVANALSPSFVSIRVPEAFHDEPGHFLALVRGLYLRAEPQFEAAKARQLAEEIIRPTAPHALIAACFEGLGQPALAVLPELYAHPKDYVSFHAAVAGTRLGDHIAADALALHARNPQSPHRFQAIRALGAARRMANAAHTLRGLIEDSDPRIQVAAYEALIVREDPFIESRPIADDNFQLDVVPSRRANIIYVKRREHRRIALFGDALRCAPPLHYAASDGSLTINAYPQDDELTLVRVVPTSATTSPPIHASTEVRALIEMLGRDAGLDDRDRVNGLGLDYGAVVHALHHLCEDEAINARFVLEEPNAAEMFGPDRPKGRPESELGAVAIAKTPSDEEPSPVPAADQ